MCIVGINVVDDVIGYVIKMVICCYGGIEQEFVFGCIGISFWLCYGLCYVVKLQVQCDGILGWI